MRYDRYKSVADLVKDRAWTRPYSYMGPQYLGYVIAITQNRDSDILERSNFQAMKSLFGRHCSVEGASHWACGWVEYIMVKTTAVKTLEKLREALNALADYPILDDSLYSEMECEEQDQTAENNKSGWARDVLSLVLGKNHDATDKEIELAESVAVAVYLEDCGYCGTEDAWVGESSIKRWAENEWVNDKLKGNELADKLRDMCKKTLKLQVGK